jgi:hypothetical protein
MPSVDAAPSADGSASGPEAKITIDRAINAGYTIETPSDWNLAEVENGLYFSPPAPITSVYVFEPETTPGSSPPEYVLDIGQSQGSSIFVRGDDLDELAASMNAAYVPFGGPEGAITRATIDGEPARVIERTISTPDNTIWFGAIVIHEGHPLAITMGAPPSEQDSLRAAFQELIASIRWTD